MNRRDFFGLTAAGTGAVAAGCFPCAAGNRADAPAPAELKLLPYPQQVSPAAGSLPLGQFHGTAAAPSPSVALALASLNRFAPKTAPTIPARLGSVEEHYDRSWLRDEENHFLGLPETSPEASIVKITTDGITVVGKSRWGTLYGAQTINQLMLQAAREGRQSLPCLSIRDWPDMRWRCLAPTLTWYSGWNRLEGYDLCNWSEGEWKWLADWSLLHKCNAWAVCMYGYWPFRLPGYERETLDVDSFFYNPTTGKREPHRFTHPNIKREFFPEVIRYANQRGVQVHAYIGKNSFNGCSFRNNAAVYAGGAAEMLPFAPGVEEYWSAFIGRILELGFNGFVFEDPEANHVPNQNAQCYKTFWEPWAAKYGYSSVKQTNADGPPLGVHIEYYTWLFRTFDRLVQTHARRLGRETQIYLISHVLLARVMAESKTQQELRQWIDLIDRKQGRKVPFVITESNEPAYVRLLGKDRVASLGGRGGSCTNAMRRIASVNNDWVQGAMGADLAYERDCQIRIKQAGGFGAMGYIFEWTNTEVFGYLAAQHLWRNAGIPGVSNTDQVGILDYSYRLYYGDEVGRLVARAMDEGSDVNDAMVLENVNGSQYPSTGKALHRDYQLLAALADHAEGLARRAFRLYTGAEPKLFEPAYRQESFAWNGYDVAADKLFKTERLRLLWVSTRRSQEMCRTALAHRLAQRLIAEGAPAREVLKQYDRAIEFARSNQLIYQLNYDDDYDWTDGLCAKLTEELETQRGQFLAALGNKPALDAPVPERVRASAKAPVLFVPWEQQTEIVPRASQSPGLYLSTDLALTTDDDFFRLGVVYSVQAQSESGPWKTVFRHTLHRRDKGWQHWEIMLPNIASAATLRLRLITDSYSRAQDRSAPTWKWALWGEPRLARISQGGRREVVCDLSQRIGGAKCFVKLDDQREERAFDHPGEDSSGATFELVPRAERGQLPEPFKPAIAAFTPHRDGKAGITIAEFDLSDLSAMVRGNH